jgi:trimethylamine--corrinoid protein Co-methyltransferase
MATPRIRLLSQQELKAIHETSLRILREVGVVIRHEYVLEQLAEAGAQVDKTKNLVRFKDELVETAVAKAQKQYVLYGRDRSVRARFGYGDMNMISSPGQFAWFDLDSGERRQPLLSDARQAIKVGDALTNITIVGAMVVPVDVPEAMRDVALTAELLRGSVKPTRCWPVTRQSSRYVLEMYKAVAGGEQPLRDRPMTEVFLEPISPLQLPTSGLDVMLEFLECRQPVSIGPMVMASGTGPATLAGTMAQENAEILAGIVTVETIAPGTPVLYGGIPHIMDPRTSICAFGSPEQGLMAIGMAELAHVYGFPVYINVNLTDSKTLDVQAGMEKMGSFVVGMLAGADLFGHAGLIGTDHGASLPWLVVDDEAMGHARRISRGFEVNDETLAGQVIAEVGPAGNFLVHEHTLAHFREQLHIPSPRWTRDTYETWVEKDGRGMGERATDRVRQIMETHETPPLEPALLREIEKIEKAAEKELVR